MALHEILALGRRRDDGESFYLEGAVVRAEHAPNLWGREVVHREVEAFEVRARSARGETTEGQSYASGEDQRELPQAHRRHEDPGDDASGSQHTRERAH